MFMPTRCTVPRPAVPTSQAEYTSADKKTRLISRVSHTTGIRHVHRWEHEKTIGFSRTVDISQGLGTDGENGIPDMFWTEVIIVNRRGACQ